MTKTQEMLANYVLDLTKNGNERRRFRNAMLHTLDKLIEQDKIKIEGNVKSYVIGMLAEASLAVVLNDRKKDGVRRSDLP